MIEEGDDVWSRLAPVWRRVAVASAQHSPFLSAAWMQTWFDCRGDVGARALVWEDPAGEPVACALLPVSTSRRALVRVRQAFLNATGGLSVASEHNALLSLPGHRSAAVRDLVGYMLAELRADEFHLRGATADSYRRFEEVWPKGRVECQNSESPYVDMAALRAAGQTYLSALSSNTRSQVRRSIRLYEEAFGPPRFDCATSLDQRLQWLEDLADLHGRHWRAKGDRGAFSDGRLDFHRALVRATADADEGELRIELSRLVFGAQTVGMLYHLVYRRRASFYQSAFRYDDDRRLKPGLVTHAFAVQRLMEQGLDEYDFLGGELKPVRYKRSLSTGARGLVWARFRAPTFKMSALQAVRLARRRAFGVSAPRDHEPEIPRG